MYYINIQENSLFYDFRNPNGWNAKYLEKEGWKIWWSYHPYSTEMKYFVWKQIPTPSKTNRYACPKLNQCPWNLLDPMVTQGDAVLVQKSSFLIRIEDYWSANLISIKSNIWRNGKMKNNKPLDLIQINAILAHDLKELQEDVKKQRKLKSFQKVGLLQ